MIDRHQERAILKQVNTAPVLLVGETPGFVGRGGMISFINIGNVIRLELNGTVFISNGLTGKRGSFIHNAPSYITLLEVNANGIQDTRIPVYQSVVNRFSGWYLDTSVAHFYPWLKRASIALFKLKE